MGRRKQASGFTSLEMVVVVGIIGILTVAAIPSVLNSMATRNLDNSARDIQTTLQQARYRAVDTKINHRVRFAQTSGTWMIYLERETAPNTWAAVPKYLVKAISTKYTVTINLPAGQAIEFSSVGVIEGFDSTKNSVTLQSLALKTKGQPDLRIIRVFGGGSIRYDRGSS